MAIPPALVAGHRTGQQQLEELVRRDLIRFWRTVDLSDARAATDQLRPAVRELTATYGDMAAVLAADFYDEARSAAGAPGSFRATAAPVAERSHVDAMVRWAVTPIWATDPRHAAALTRLAGGTQRLTRRPARETIHRAVSRDPADARYVREPRHDACAFCLMLASRAYGETTFTSRQAATRVVGREVRERGRVIDGGWQTGRIVGRAGPRGPREVGDRFHDDCRCQSMPVWSDDDVPAVNQQLSAEWDDVAAGELDPLQAWRDHIRATRGTN